MTDPQQDPQNMPPEGSPAQETAAEPQDAPTAPDPNEQPTGDAPDQPEHDDPENHDASSCPNCIEHLKEVLDQNDEAVAHLEAFVAEIREQAKTGAVMGLLLGVAIMEAKPGPEEGQMVPTGEVAIMVRTGGTKRALDKLLDEVQDSHAEATGRPKPSEVKELVSSFFRQRVEAPRPGSEDEHPAHDGHEAHG